MIITEIESFQNVIDSKNEQIQQLQSMVDTNEERINELKSTLKRKSCIHAVFHY